MSGSPVAHRRAPAALVAPLLAALVAGVFPGPTAAAPVSPRPSTEIAVPAEARTHDTPAADAGISAAAAAAPAAVDPKPPVDAAVAPAAPATMPADAQPELRPSIAYEEAMAHEHDPNDFVPGGLVDVGFRPRGNDRWPIDGHAPTDLPPGRATGRQMAASKQGSQWTDVTPGTGRDAHAGNGASDPASSGAPATDPAAASGTTDAATTDAPPTAGEPSTDAPIDAAAGDPVVDASGASFTQPVDAAGDLAAASGLRRQVFGFLPYWELSGAASKLNYDVLSTIAYFSVGATKAGNLRKQNADGSNTTGWGGWTSSSMTSVINAAHQRGTRVALTISVFAWTSDQAAVQKAILGSATARTTLAKQAAAAVRDRGADGINLDFEPLASGYADEFVLFLKAVRSELNKIRSGYQLTYDTTGYIGNYPLESSVGAGAADAIFIMGYDYRTGSSSTAGSIDPLSGPTYDLTDTVRAYTARVAPSRIILGLPWYGRAWSTTTSGVRSTNHSGTKFGASTTVNYESLTDLVTKYGRRWDSVEQSPYVAYQRQNCTSTYGCVTSWREIYYDDGASLKARLSMVNDYGLRGAGMWALGYDGGHAELYRAFSDSFLVDKSAPQAGVKALVAAQGDEGFVVTWAAQDLSSIASYDVQVSTNGGAWTDWRKATTATSDVWLGKDNGGYAFRVRARDSKGNTGAWNVTAVYAATPTIAVGGFGRVTTDGLAYRSGPGTSSTKLGTIPAGTIVAFTSGPKSANGYTWYEVTQPVTAWGPVGFVERGVWIAVKSSTATMVTAYRAPNTTKVDAGLAGLDFGSGGSAIGTASTSVATRTFSPNGDGSEDGIPLRWTNTVAMTSLTLRVFTAAGALAGSVAVPALAAGGHAWSWNGKVGSTRVADGRYVLQLVGVAGSKTYSAPSARPVTAAQITAYGITVDTTPPAVTSSSASSSLLSPNGDAVLDSVRLALATTGAVRWTAGIANAKGVLVRTGAGTGGSVTWTWAGTDDAGAKVPDGRYTVTLSTWDTAGNRATRSFAVTADTTAPAIAPKAAGSIFSPNNDGAADTTTLSWTSSEPAAGTARLYHGTTLVRSWTITKRSSWSVAWDGRKADGTAVADGTYAFKVALKDAAGNGRTASANVVIDRTTSSLRWSRRFYPQDGDALRPTSQLSWTTTRTATATLRLYDAAGSIVRQVYAGKSMAAGSHAWTWDGRRGDRTMAPQGRYTARLTVTSSFGTQTLERTVWATAFVVTPSVTSVKPGQTFTVHVEPVEPVSTRPVVTFTQPGRAGVSVAATKLADGSYRATFKVATGSAGNGAIKVSAKDTGGHVNTTTLGIAVRAS